MSVAAPGGLVIALLLVWTAHDGGYDADTWYWGALLLTGALSAMLIARGARAVRLSRAGAIALAALAGYVAWSFASIAWAQSPGDALQGSDRALLYLLVFALVALTPWTARSVQTALIAFVLAAGAIGLVLLVRLATGDHIGALVVQGRLAAPTGYFNATAALFTAVALTGLLLSTRRELPLLVRAALVAVACLGLQLAVIVQSRGWLFTLPLVALTALALARRRAAAVGAGALAVACGLPNLPALLHVYGSASGDAFTTAAEQAGRGALAGGVAALGLAAAAALADRRLAPRTLGAGSRRALTAALAVLSVAGVLAGALAVTHGHPLRFAQRQWHGFSHQETVYASGSHFGDVGSGRYDFWRAALHAFAAEPVGGLGQDNFADYYVTHRHTAEEPSWTHSLELRLLAHTGLVGAALFVVFLVAALRAALRARRRDELGGPVAGAALVALAVWLIHGSLDWFWEIPALSGPALGFLGMAVALDSRHARPLAATAGGRARRPLGAATAVALAAAGLALALPFLSVRELSRAADLRAGNPAGALRALSRAAALDPLSAEPGRVAGVIALQNGLYAQAQSRFEQAIAREPGGWLAWLGAGLAAGARGDSALARRDFARAAAINSQQPAVLQALHDSRGPHPLTPARAIALLVPVA